MFWKKAKVAEKPVKAAGEKPAAEQPAVEKPAGEKPVAKVKPVSAREIIIGQVEKIEAGKSLAFRLPKDFGDWQLVVELNTRPSSKGKKYMASREDIVNDVPSGKKFFYFDTNDAHEIAEWVMDRKAKLV